MGSKRNKDPILDDNSWRTHIEHAVLDDNNWKVKVVLIEAAGRDQDRLYLDKFAEFASEEKRFVIKNVCKTETIFMINQLGSEKKVKDDGFRVFEEAQKFLSDKKDIPSVILALIIKYLILKMKEEYLFIQRQKLQVREGLKRESTTMLDGIEIRGTVGIPIPEPSELVPPSKGKGKKEVAEPPFSSEPLQDKKYNTSLRVRGEEWRDKVYVDDFPQEGPNIYVTITGFANPEIPAHLIKFGIPLTAIVQIRVNPISTKVPSGLMKCNKRTQSQTELLIDKYLKFWDDLQSLRIHKDYEYIFVNTAFVIFTPPYCSDSLSDNPEKIYDEISFLLYDIQDLSRQHQHYLDNMNIISIPVEVKNDDRYNLYNHLIDGLPIECVNIYSVLDSILQTTYHNLDFEESRSSMSTEINAPRSSKSKGINKDSLENNKLEKTENLIKDLFTTLCKTELDKKSYRLTYGAEYETYKDPIVINYGDFARYTTFHLGNINLNNIVCSTLLGMPINKLWLTSDRLTDEQEAKVNFHVNILLSCFDRDDVEIAELNRLIHLLACRKLYNNRSSLKKRHLLPSAVQNFKKKYLKRSVLAQPLQTCFSASCSQNQFPSFPSIIKIENESYVNEEEIAKRRMKFLFYCPDISELVSAVEIENYKPINHIIDEFEYFEDLSITSGCQVMLDTFNKFNCVDYKYCEVTDCFLLMFYNSHDSDGIAREEWRFHLATPVCLEDFFDFVLDEHYEWIQNEENMYYDNVLLKTKSESKDFIDPNALTSCIEETDIELDLLMDGSLKYEEIMKAGEVSAETVITPLKKNQLSSSTLAGTIKQIKTMAASTPKNINYSDTQPHHQSETSVPKLVKPFFGYDLGNRRVEVFGRDSTYFSKDGTKVSTMYTLVTPANAEYIVLNILPGNSHNEFWIHKALGDNIRPDILDTCESFRINTKDQLMINLTKQNYELTAYAESSSFAEDSYQNKYTTKLPKNSKIALEVLPSIETKYYHSLLITWPNGLITESVHEYNSPVISHIKQYYIRPLPEINEDVRCISLNGEVIIFRPSGIINVLTPDGIFISINKYYKKAVVNESAPESVLSNSDTNKKGMGRMKDKSSRSSSKSSKVPIIEEETISPNKISYRLEIEEYEITEANGLRQKWINDVCYDLESLLIRTATDFCVGEVFSRRIDNTHILLNVDGLLVVTFPDKTRIITAYEIEETEIEPEWTDEERVYFNLFDTGNIELVKSTVSQTSYAEAQYYDTGSILSSTSNSSKKNNEKPKCIESEGFVSIQLVYTIEHANFSTVTIKKKNGEIFIESPNETTVNIHPDCHYDFILDNRTTAKFNGKTLDVTFEACPDCKAFTTASVKIVSDTDPYLQKPDHWVKMEDSFCKKIFVDDEGTINIQEENSTEVIQTDEIIPTKDDCQASIVIPESTVVSNIDMPIDGKSESSMVSHGKCRDIYMAKNFKFFVLKRDLTCVEVVHRALLDQYKQACRWQPWCSINQYDTFGDNRSLLSILSPVSVTESEKWLMHSKISNKPKQLKYKDLKKDSGKGFYHWMRPYKRFKPEPMKADPVLPARLPRAFILRVLEHQWSEEQRENLKGANELLRAVLKYRLVIENESRTFFEIPIIDDRLEEERRIDEVIQALAHRVYTNLKTQLANDIHSRANATITTKPHPEPSELSFEGESDFGCSFAWKQMDGERQSLLKETDAAAEMSPALQRYWRRRSEGAKEQSFYTYLLREGSVPPYFRNVLGGAIWWDVNHIAGEAVGNSERRKMSCSCAEDEGSSRDEKYLKPFM